MLGRLVIDRLTDLLHSLSDGAKMRLFAKYNVESVADLVSVLRARSYDLAKKIWQRLDENQSLVKTTLLPNLGVFV